MITFLDSKDLVEKEYPDCVILEAREYSDHFTFDLTKKKNLGKLVFGGPGQAKVDKNTGKLERVASCYIYDDDLVEKGKKIYTYKR